MRGPRCWEGWREGGRESECVCVWVAGRRAAGRDEQRASGIRESLKGRPCGRVAASPGALEPWSNPPCFPQNHTDFATRRTGPLIPLSPLSPPPKQATERLSSDGPASTGLPQSSLPRAFPYSLLGRCTVHRSLPGVHRASVSTPHVPLLLPLSLLRPCYPL